MPGKYSNAGKSGTGGKISEKFSDDTTIDDENDGIDLIFDDDEEEETVPRYNNTPWPAGPYATYEGARAPWESEESPLGYRMGYHWGP